MAFAHVALYESLLWVFQRYIMGSKDLRPELYHDHI